MIADEKCLVQREMVMWDEMWTDWKVEVEAVGSRWKEVTFEHQCQCAIVGPHSIAHPLRPSNSATSFGGACCLLPETQQAARM
jgi:hypothetical protein